MPREIITIHVGQCGNQLGAKFWEQLCNEHGIAEDGTLQEFATQTDDRKDVFFYQADDLQYVPRALLLDLEPRVINRVSTQPYGRLFNRENIFIHKDGSGAGNVWPRGYNQAAEVQDHILEMIDREADGSDSLEGFMLIHSVAGGTGSGMGSNLLETLADRYPKKLIQTCSVFPSDTEITVQPYNTMLTLQRLITHADSVIAFDNKALDRIVDEKLRIPNATSDETNALITTVLAASTATIRFPGYLNNDLMGLVASLIPTPRMHFLIPGYTPYTAARQEHAVKKTSELNIMKRLLDPKNILTSANTKKGCYISMLNILQGDVNPTEVHKSLQTIRDRQLANFIPWGPSSIQVAIARKSPYVPPFPRISGTLLANHTSIRFMFKQITNDFNKLFVKKMFLKQFTDEADCEESTFEEARDIVGDLIKEYEAAESADYMNFGSDPMASPSLSSSSSFGTSLMAD